MAETVTDEEGRKFKAGEKCPVCKDGTIYLLRGGMFSNFATVKCDKCGKEATGYASFGGLF